MLILDMGAARTFLLNLILYCDVHYRTGTADQFDTLPSRMSKKLWQAGRLNHHFRTAVITRLRT